MKALVRSAAVGTVKLLAVVADPLYRPLPGPRILIYHDVSESSSSQMAVTPDMLESQVDWLRIRGTIVSLEEAIERRSDPDADTLFVLTFDDGHRGLYDSAFAMLKAKEVPFTIYLNTAPLEGTGPPRPGTGAMKWDEVREMLDSGLVTLGAHTHSHVDMRTVTGQIAKEELTTANDLLLSRTGVAPRHFAYPWGYWSDVADTLVRDLYDSAALGSGPGIGPDQDPFLLNRIPVQASDGKLFFKAKIRGGMRFEDRMRRLAKGYRGP